MPACEGKEKERRRKALREKRKKKSFELLFLPSRLDHEEGEREWRRRIREKKRKKKDRRSKGISLS